MLKTMFKRYSVVLITFILLFVFLTGCGSSSSKSDSAVMETSRGGGVSYNSASNSKVTLTSKQSNYYDGGQSAADTNSNSQSAQDAKEDIKKVIKNGDISVEVKDVDIAYEGIMKIVESLGGEEFNKNYTISGEYKRMELVLKIPPEKLNLFEQKIKEYVGEGKVRNINIRSRDITSEYYDYTARLESYQASRDQMRELLKKAQNIDETLRIQQELTRLQAEIDSMQGQVKMWDKLIDMATINLYIDEEDNPFKKTTAVSWKFNSPAEIWSTMKNGFVGVVNTIYSLLIWILIAVVSLSPVIAVASIVIYVIFFVKKKRKQK
ncbi:MAG TPA: DUF4349 domain-containing protein [Clostridiales bacterium]|nr:DUF4349 domain-containing protein [Clostridiales bacterium]